MQTVNYIARNLTVTEETKKHISKKLQKFNKLLENAISITVNISQNNPSGKGGITYKVEITVSMPRAFIKVELKGANINAIVDKLDSPFKKRLERYHNRFKHWEEKGQNWKVIELNNSIPNDLNENDNYSDYSPVIKRKVYVEDRPMHPAEAIEHMELLGHKSFLFKNIESNKYAMIYKRDIGGYGLVEPKS